MDRIEKKNPREHNQLGFLLCFEKMYSSQELFYSRNQTGGIFQFNQLMAKRFDTAGNNGFVPLVITCEIS